MRRSTAQTRPGHGHYLPPGQLQQQQPFSQQQQQQQHAEHQVAHHPPPHHARPAVAAAPATGPTSHLTTTSFASLPLAAASQRSLTEVLRFEFLTSVQEATLPAVLNGGDVMARAKTGTGKTMAFLIPAVEALCRAPPRSGSGISVLVLSPTRELASQIAKEAEALLRFHPYKAQVVYGGTNINSERNRLAGRCDVLVATPGRLIDHLENSGLAATLQGIRTLVLDEADQLLEMGFRPAIEKILSFLPKSRQTLLFSATMPQAVQQVAGLALKKQHAFIDTIGEEDSATNTQARLPAAPREAPRPLHSPRVEQSYALVPMEDQFTAIFSVLRRHAQTTPDHKIISARDKASKEFRTATSAILFSSDVSARGVDYPDVTMVLQVGIPSSREQYIHRLGRTARAGRAGVGLLILMPEEQHFMRQLRDLPLTAEPGVPTTPQDVAAVKAGLARVGDRLPDMAYAAWLGFYNSAKGMGWSKPELVQQANRFSAVMGLSQPPPLQKKTIGMMGLKGVPGLRIDDSGGGGGGRSGGWGGAGANGGGGRQQQARPAQVHQGASYGSVGANGEGGAGRKRGRGNGGGRGGGGGGGGGRGRGPPPGASNY
ncbi:hypothetical protein CHLNCDRAFT_59143 [Chlorella variabilis]|uniref:ATP-dependent RNA helicase n=1 Tax=Chlorella variabilis TaxID=554065 RepID=E1ZR16_CHLVA|nr:hypothetical protein CHLNCDRAFT_59143 [Chlorella variabilis]EFN51650.1 hypothetical protein CHLNCDRAFT_59143 [Chlorella variabilis]|eukprot:XP_005843752.1 hypothetical protein CHLNCDRAFT_59143 [Chlorella variabilis]